MAACPQTTFVGAHVGGHAEDLGAVGRALTELSNFHVDTAGRMGELGRQPRAFAQFVEDFGDRILFGSDCFPIDDDAFHTWWRFLETADEHFDYGTPGEPRRRATGGSAVPPCPSPRCTRSTETTRPGSWACETRPGRQGALSRTTRTNWNDASPGPSLSTHRSVRPGR